MTQPGKTRVAILGGGIAALTTAFELTEQDPDKSSYEITVYTLGWRLGGKGAVGRDKSQYGRAYEHGLHVWAGFYDNAFDVVKRLYARIGKDPDAWKTCFEPLAHFTAMEYVGGAWKPWLLQFPVNDLEPGLGPALALTPLPLFLQFLVALEGSFNGSDLAGFLGPAERLAAEAEVASVSSSRALRGEETVLTLAREAAARIPSDPSLFTDDNRQALADLLRIGQGQIATALEAAPNTDALRRLEILYDLAFAIANGLLADDVLFRGFEAIDDIEWSAWLRRSGCKPENLESAIVRGCYDYAFAGGAAENPGIGAGTGTLLLLRLLLTYKGSIFYALSAPMGDSIFAPLFQYLRHWGVKFEFFCRVTELRLSETEPLVDEIVLAQQVCLANPACPYDPLILSDKGFWTWPLRPDPSQILNSEHLDQYDLSSAWTDWPDAVPERKLTRRSAGKSADGEQDIFDIAVLATGFGGLEAICHELKHRFRDTWGKSFEKIVTTQTIALQLWLGPQTGQLGWPDPRTTLTAFERPEDGWSDAPLTSWEDNSRLLRLENERPYSKPGSLAYFVGVFPDAAYIPKPGPDPSFPVKELDRAKAAILEWMDSRLSILWPNASSPMPPGFRWELLEAPPDQIGRERLNSQYWRVNINPSERYVLSAPDSVQYRLWPDGSGIDNLYLAGDWVRSGVNGGCIEAAVIAGRMVARAITESDMFINGDGSNSGDFSIPITALPLVSLADKLKSAAAGGLGAVDAYCATIAVTVAYAQSKLPAGLRLVTPPHWDKLHPILLIFSRQRNVRPGFLPFGGLNYHEFIEIIPYVERTDTDAPTGGPFSYMPYLLLDQTLPVLVGANVYGFKKRLARISSRDGAFDINGDLGEIRANFDQVGLPGTIDKFPELDHGRKLIERPFISQMSTGEWVYSFLDYRLDSATCQRVSGEVAIGEPFAPAGGNEPYPVHPSGNIPWFRFSTNWRLSIPLTSGQLSDTSAPSDLRNIASQLRGGRFGQLFRR